MTAAEANHIEVIDVLTSEEDTPLDVNATDNVRLSFLSLFSLVFSNLFVCLSVFVCGFLSFF